MKNYETFKNELIERVSETFTNCEVISSTITKLNIGKLDSIVVKVPNQATSPTMYINYAYEAYTECGDFDEVVNNVCRAFTKALEESTLVSEAAETLLKKDQIVRSIYLTMLCQY